MKQSLGSLAFVLTLFINVPQAVKVIKTKHTKDLSLVTYILLFFASLSWVIYGLLGGDIAIWGSNAVGLLVCATILVYKLRYG